ncbi:MAG TPA: endolytic transglycosylase MltG, partial [Candidatus Limnocylindria bacterium]|nr:endolytic transglycosylase MltG [Candidatus Limnocylindria bacterium]
AVNKAFPTISKEAFSAAAVVGDRKNTVLAGMDAKAPLEGYLFPDTYFMRPDASAVAIVDLLLDTFERKAGTALRVASAERKTSIYDIVKLASIVEREARDRAESPTIAGVYQNRLGIGMKLDADPTIQYALGDGRELALDDLKLESPYNTYLVAGLPPTPICSPGLAALEAAARPASVPYFFFVAKADGTGDHAFATTIEEHEANRVKYGNK